MAVLLLRLPKVVLGFFLTVGPCRGALGACGTSGVPCPHAVSSGTCPPCLGPEPLLYTLLWDRPAHVGDRQVLPEGASAPKGDSGQERPLRPLPLSTSPSPPPHQLSGHVPVSGRDWQEPGVSAARAADSSTALVPAAALGHPAAQSSPFPVTQAPTSRGISIQAGDGDALVGEGAATSCLLWELTHRASPRGRVLAKTPLEVGTGPWAHRGNSTAPWYQVPVLPRCPHPATATSAVAEFPIAR